MEEIWIEGSKGWNWKWKSWWGRGQLSLCEWSTNEKWSAQPNLTITQKRGREREELKFRKSIKNKERNKGTQCGLGRDELSRCIRCLYLMHTSLSLCIFCSILYSMVFYLHYTTLTISPTHNSYLLTSVFFTSHFTYKSYQFPPLKLSPTNQCESLLWWKQQYERNEGRKRKMQSLRFEGVSTTHML